MMEMHHLQQIKENVLRCMGCGVCRGVWDRRDEAICPVWATGFGFEDSTPRGRVTVAQDLLEGHFNYSLPLAESIYRCTDCASCSVICDAMDPETGKPIVDVPAVVRAIRMDLVENSLVPPRVRDYFKAVHVNGNPYKIPQEDRGRWAEGTNVRLFDGQEYLLYVGDVGSFDERGIKMARFVAEALDRGGVDFGILAGEEMSDGNDVHVLGEAGLFAYLAETNIRVFEKAGIKKVISLDPHSYNAFRNDYPAMGSGFQVFHYTQVLSDAVKSGRFFLRGLGAKVTYHDPCYLGRHNEIYNAPRDLLNAIPGLEMVEMKRNRKNAFCCGGGGGNFYTDILGGGRNSANRIRVREALETGAEILAVACPLCAKMLEDGIRAESLDNRLSVKDPAQILLEALG